MCTRISFVDAMPALNVVVANSNNFCNIVSTVLLYLSNLVQMKSISHVCCQTCSSMHLNASTDGGMGSYLKAGLFCYLLKHTVQSCFAFILIHANHSLL